MDKQYLTVCAVYKLLKRGKIDKNCAKKLLNTKTKIKEYCIDNLIRNWMYTDEIKSRKL